MKKLVLNVEALEVETFMINSSGEKPGTVAAQEATAIHPVCMSGLPIHCLPTSDPHDVYCVFASADASNFGNCNCTPVCATNTCDSENIC